MSIVGNDVTLWINVGTEAAPAFEMIAEQRSLSYEKSREMIDASHKGSDHNKSVYGRMSGSFTLDALHPDPDAGANATLDLLQDAIDNKNEITVRMKQNSRLLQTTALVGSVSAEFPDNDVSTLSCELTAQAPFAEVPPAA